MTERIPGDYSAFASEALVPADTTVVADKPTDEASLILTVYDKLGLLNGSTKEQLTESLPADIALLRSQHDEDLEPFLAVNLTPSFGLRALVAGFDNAYAAGWGYGKTICTPSHWDGISLNILNKRTVGASQPIGQLSLRGALLTAQNKFGEPGLILTNFTVKEQKKAAAGMVLDNQTDWLVKEAMRREAGLPSLDKETITLFPQQPIVGAGDYAYVGSARYFGPSVIIDKTYVGSHYRSGVRFSKGLIPQPQA